MHTADVLGFIQAFRHADVRALGDEELAERCLSVTTLLDVVDTYAAELLAEFQQRGIWAEDGATSGAAWVAARSNARRADLASLANVGAALRQLPAVTVAARRGDIGFDHVRRIKDCARKRPGLSAQEETFLLDQAQTFNADMFRVVARQWRSVAEDNADDEVAVEEPARRESVHLSQTIDGCWRLDGELNPENGAIVAAYFDEQVDKSMRAQRDDDPALEKLPASALRAKALVDLVAQHQRRDPEDRHTVADRYRVAIVIRPDEFPMEACDADRYRAVINAEGEVLDIGRLSREWTDATRRAINLRDGGCIFPGCDRPPSWRDVHHCWEWEHGGPTCQDNGALLCRRHHTFIHAKKWRVVIARPRGKPIVLRPDGTPFTIQQWRLAV